jgi:DeoR/GlpR family transcriptional regulator of sugar metabolism
MFAAERLRIIRSYVLEKKKASVAEISRMLGVSEVTIRRDLEALDEEGFLIRTHGGRDPQRRRQPRRLAIWQRGGC